MHKPILIAVLSFVLIQLVPFNTKPNEEGFPQRQIAQPISAMESTKAVEAQPLEPKVIEQPQTPPTPEPPSKPKGGCEAWMAEAGIASTEATKKLILKESSCNPRAINPSSGACGIPQSWPCSKLPCPLDETGAVCQLEWMEQYVINRYGGWEQALSAWYSRCGSPQGCWY